MVKLLVAWVPMKCELPAHMNRSMAAVGMPVYRLCLPSSRGIASATMVPLPIAEQAACIARCVVPLSVAT